MQRRPVPIIIMSVAKETAEAALTALDLGAIDFVQKPTALASEKIFEVSTELIEKVKAAGSIALNRISAAPPLPSPVISAPEMRVSGSHSVDLVVIDTAVAARLSGAGCDGDAHAGRLHRDVRSEAE
jgi:two-component system chemotaxis response regulator CheB